MKTVAVMLCAAALLVLGCRPETKPPTPAKPSELIKLTEGNFQEQVLRSQKPVMVDVSTTWCGPCQRMAPVVEELATEYKGRIVFGQLDGDDNDRLMQQYHIKGYPTFLFFKDGKEIRFNNEQTIGVTPKEALGRQLQALLE
jgi:thioredoxin 1